jgi:hypothetical protein
MLDVEFAVDWRTRPWRDALVDAECLRYLVIALDGSASVGMELLEKALEFSEESGPFECATVRNG